MVTARKDFGELDALEGDMERFLDQLFPRLNHAYSRALERVVRDLEGQVHAIDDDADGYLMPDLDRVAAARLELVRASGRFEQLWKEWNRSLVDLEDLTSRWFGAAGTPVSRSVNAILSELRGLWPTANVPGSGTAARFHNLSVFHRQELANIVTRSVLGQSTRQGLINELRKVTGRSEGQAEKLFHDATMEHSRSVSHVMAKDRGYKHYQYFGPDDQITRPFCDRIIRGVYSEDEIAKMDNGQTGTGTVFTAGGGYWCRHHWRPVKEEWFDEDEWADLRGDQGEAVA